MEDYKRISVTINEEKRLRIQNPTGYPLIGNGRQGAVFLLEEDKCIKIYAEETVAEAETKAYLKAQGCSLMPRLYEVGNKFIIIEYIKGPDLKTFLQTQGKMPQEIAVELVNMFHEFKNYNFLRRDESLRHILLKNNQKIKLVDHTYAFTLKNPYPVKLFRQLKAIGMLDYFIEQCKLLDQVLFNEFKENMLEYALL